MKITEIEVTLTHLPKGVPQSNTRAVYAPVVEVHTDEGLIGVSAGTFNSPAEAVLIEQLGERLIGEDPLQPEAVHRKLAPEGAWALRGSATFTQAAGILDVALWDILGKAANQPLWRLLGGNRDTVPCYATTRMRRELKAPGPLAEEAATIAAEGFRSMKMNLGGEPSVEAEVERVRTVREAVGNDVRIMADANNMYTPAQALAVGRRIEEYQLTWLEDPIAIHDVHALVDLCHALDTPIATGETLIGLTAFRPYLEARAFDVPMADVQSIGGITPFRKLAAAAEMFGFPVVPHFHHEISAHLIAAAPNGLIVEYGPRTSALFQGSPELVNGELHLSGRPGLGLEIDRAFVNKQKV
jgi:L-alanine-DL-glutamate epimerase-like enolase superfamily enzyme